MHKTLHLLFFLLLNIYGTINAQNTYIQEQLITIHHDNSSLETVLDELTANYQISFSYSNHYISLTQLINIHADEELLKNVLDRLFESTDIEHAYIGSQVVLKKNEKKNNNRIGGEANDSRLSSESNQLESSKEETYYIEPVKRDNTAQAYDYRNETDLAKVAFPKALTPMEIEPFEVELEDFELEKKLHLKLSNFIQLDEAQKEEIEAVAQTVSNEIENVAEEALENVNELSILLFQNTTERVKGITASLFKNTVTKEMQGLQVSVFKNISEGTTDGMQVSGIRNVAKGSAKGFQICSISNYTEEGKGNLQFSCFNNTTKTGNTLAQLAVGNKAHNVNGIQAGGIWNHANGRLNGLQLATITNNAKELNGMQIGLTNKVKEELNGMQIGLVNVSNKMRGIQIGLINIADTVSVGAPIGLINIVKKGYNKVEISANESIHTSLTFKVGAKSFHNILYVGKRFGENTWALGYGFGSYADFNERTGINFELFAAHINERETWTSKLNALIRFQPTITVKMGKRKRTSFLIGPNLNAVVSNRLNADTQALGSSIMPYTLYEKEVTGPFAYNYQIWVGGSLGIQF